MIIARGRLSQALRGSGDGNGGVLSRFGVSGELSAQIPFYPFVQHVEAPRSRPCGSTRQEIIPDLAHIFASQKRLESRRPIAQACRDSFAQRASHPIFPLKSESPFRLCDKVLWQELTQRGNEERFWLSGIAFLRFGEREHVFDERRIKEWHAHFKRVVHAHRVGIAQKR